MTSAAKTENPEEIRRRISEEKRRRLLDRNQRLASLDAPMRDPGFVQSIAKAEGKLLTAQANLDALRAGDPKKNRKAIKRAENQVRDLAEELAKIQEQERSTYLLYGQAREPIILARMRGEEVEAYEAETAEVLRDEHGARIIIRRGENRGLPRMKYDVALRAKKLAGVQHAYAHGHLGDHPESERRLDTGEHYGQCYEIIKGMTSTAGEGGGGFGPKGPQPRVIEAGQDLRGYRAGLSPRQEEALDRICGDGMRLGQAAAAMRADARTVKRLLISGLDDAGRSLAAERTRRNCQFEEAA